MNYLEVSLENARFNYRYIKRFCNKKVICVVKSDAYGQGAAVLAKLYQNLGAYAFAVASLDEAINLRKIGITRDILVLGYTPTEDAFLLNEYSLTQSLISYRYAKLLDDAARNGGFILKCHLEIDSGMGRYGFSYKREDFSLIRDALNLKNLSITGLYTHFCVANEKDNPFNLVQIERFETVKTFIENAFPNLKLFCHAESTSALFNGFISSSGAVRVGLGLYGFGNAFLKPVCALKTQLTDIRKIRKGETVGYGRKFEAVKDDTCVGVLPMGYNDGFFVPTNGVHKYSVLINNHKYPVVGEICMNHTFINLSLNENLPLPNLQDTVTAVHQSTFQDYLKSTDKSAYRAICDLGNLNKKIYV